MTRASGRTSHGQRTPGVTAGPKVAAFAAENGVQPPQPQISIEPLVNVFAQESTAVLA